MRFIGLSMAVTTGLCWAVLAIGLKHALSFSSSGTIVWVRMVVAFALLGAFFAFRRDRGGWRILMGPPLVAVLAGLGLAGNYFGYMRAIELTGASNAQIMIQAGPMMLLLIGVFYFRERPSWWQWIGVATAVIGFAFFYADQTRDSMPPGYGTGLAWLLFAALTWAFFAAVQKVLIRTWSPAEFNLLIYGISSLVLAPLVDWRELSNLRFDQFLFVALLGVNTLVAYGALGEALKRIPATHVSLIISLNPLLTILLLQLMDRFHWNWVQPEPLYWRGYLGAFLVVAGVAVAVARRRRMVTED